MFFLWLPTGFGKSLCYEVLVCVRRQASNGVVIVVISLMLDRVRSLCESGNNVFWE